MPDWAGNSSKVAQEAAAVQLPEFVPRKGVQIETDPKANNKPAITATDDNGAIEGMLKQLEVSSSGSGLQ